MSVFTRLPGFDQLIAVVFPIGPHLVSNEGRQVRADAVAVPGIAPCTG